MLLRLPPDLRDLIVNAESVSGFGVVNLKEVNEHVERWRLLYGQGQPEPVYDDQEQEYDPADPSSPANPNGGGRR